MLVVVHHATQFLDAHGWSMSLMNDASSVFSILRMPLFFTISGLLAVSAISSLALRPLLRKRVALLAYIYALWCLIWWAWFSVVERPFDEAESPVGDIVSALIVPWSGLWFVYALALYYCVAWLGRALPAVVQLAIAFAVSIVFATEVITFGEAYTWSSIGRYFIFFMVGLHARSLLFAAASKVTWPKIAALAVAFIGGVGSFVVAQKFGDAYAAAAQFLAGFVGAAFGIALSSILARSVLVTRALGALGQRTLPVYVAHPLLIALITWKLPPDFAPGVAVCAVIAAVAIAGSLALHWLLKGIPGIYTLPFRDWHPRGQLAPAVER